ncbi:MAG TPA: lipoyl(octanoyl) transferase LipB, partial [Bacteroidia bacterium]|nr:lipoyl(octanoyl) transferase LipB [Bacteroidia bacterium]
PHVYTLGKSGSEKNLLITADELAQHQATFFRINRGGDITYHGPGQCVGYPILDLDLFFNDVHKYMRYLEEVIIRTIAHYGIEGIRIPGLTGVWLAATPTKPERKICAFGVRLSRWVTMHGWALNVNNDLSFFNHIVPCGISDKAVTSIQQELGYAVEISETKQLLKLNFAHVFEVETIDAQLAF